MSKVLIFLHHKMSHLYRLYFFFLSASGEGGAHCKSAAAEIKTWWRVSEKCMCVEVCVCVCCVCVKKRIKERKRGLNLYLGVSFRKRGTGEEECYCWQGSLTLAWNGHTINTYYTHRDTRPFFCIIYEMLPLSLVLHLASTDCQEKICACVCAHEQRCVNTSMCVFIGALGTNIERSGRYTLGP